MEPSEIMTVLLDLAREAQLEVRNVDASRAEVGEAVPASAVCRVRGAVWVVLSSADPVAIQLAVLGSAIREHAGELIETRYLAPAVRVWVDPG